ncbi:hypothetical protein O181_051260 [Austropuccinia psidii MF-1]|uniref:Uncharacterized protein n=1 Tax=Austropuccinia psidii MF-1 TaxID=1389203 RepID=A0A9Q3DWT4_9BASI|nr:hypothetical protein [Austropuccinia psidii MF-1]
MRKVYSSPTNMDSAGNDELDGEELEMLKPSIPNHSSTSPSQPYFKIFQIQLIPRTSKNLQPVLSTIPSSIPPPSPSSSTARPSLPSPLRPSPTLQPRESPMDTTRS